MEFSRRKKKLKPRRFFEKKIIYKSHDVHFLFSLLSISILVLKHQLEHITKMSKAVGYVTIEEREEKMVSIEAVSLGLLGQDLDWLRR